MPGSKQKNWRVPPERRGIKCGQKMGEGRTCQQAAGYGTSHPGYGRCKFHGGTGPGDLIHAKKAMRHFGQTRVIHPHDALLEQVHEAAANCDFLREKVQQLQADAGVIGLSQVDKLRLRELMQEDGPERLGLDRLKELLDFEEGIYGSDHKGDGKPHVLVEMYNQERDRLARFAKMALDAGIDERRVQLAEGQARMVADIMKIVAKKAASKGEKAGLRAGAAELRLLENHVRTEDAVWEPL